MCSSSYHSYVRGWVDIADKACGMSNVHVLPAVRACMGASMPLLAALALAATI